MNNTNGKCPFCDSLDIEYGDIEFNTDYVYPFISQHCLCNNCGCEFRENYKCEYVDTDVTYSPSI